MLMIRNFLQKAVERKKKVIPQKKYIAESVGTISTKFSNNTLSTVGNQRDQSSSDSEPSLKLAIDQPVFEQILGRGKNEQSLEHFVIAIAKVVQLTRFSIGHQSKHSRVRYSPFDTSVIPPPDIRFPQTVSLVASLVKFLLEANECENKYRKDLKARDTAMLIEYGNSEHGLYLRRILLRSANEPGFFEEDILNRISSLIRFHLKNSLNPRETFAPIVLRNVHSNVENSNFDQVFSDLNISFFFHEALNTLLDPVNYNTCSLPDLIYYRSARKFLKTMLKCGVQIQDVDAIRGQSWKEAQLWAKEAQQLGFCEELGGLLLLSDLTTLENFLSQEKVDKEIDLALIRENARSVNLRQRGMEGTLREARVLATGFVSGQHSPFPDVVFCLDLLE